MSTSAKVKDYMSETIYSFKLSDTVEQVIRTLDSKNLTGGPVVSGDGHLIGLISIFDIIVAATLNLFHKKLSELPPQLSVTKSVLTLSPDAPLKDAIVLIVKKRVGRVIIVDERQHPVGIFTRKDLLRYYAHEGRVIK